MFRFLPSIIRRLVQSPAGNFAASIEAKDDLECVRLLETNRDALIQPGSAFEWLKDPLDLGLTSTEIVSLIFEEKEQSPWICYKWRELSLTTLYRDPLQIDPTSIEAERALAECCGLGGIVPICDDSSWKDDVIISSDHRSAQIRLKFRYMNTMQSFLGELDEIYSSLERLGLVNDSFVILRCGTTPSEIQATRIHKSAIRELWTFRSDYRGATSIGFEDELRKSGEIPQELNHIRATSESLADELQRRRTEGVLQKFAHTLKWHSPNPKMLAVQALCLAMLSSSQAHLGPLKPCFLEHSLSLISLYGAGQFEYGEPLLYFGTVGLTCAGDMINSEVMVFSSEDIWSNRGEQHQELYDLCISPRDLMDLWGPGQFMPCQPPETTDELAAEWACGLAIRGGVIYKPSESSPKMHWAAKTADYEPKGVPFKVDLLEPITIGAIDPTNSGCPTKSNSYYNTVARSNISTSIEELGTRPVTWQLQEKQIGIQGGQFLNGTLNGTLIRKEGQTRKQKGVKKVNLDFLNRPWGLLVSVCTGIAQRVALREVIAEVMLPMVDANMERSEEWQALMTTGDGVLKELKKATFRSWFETLTQKKQDVLNRYLQDVLESMSWTGINDAGSLVVSCPTLGDSNGCVHIPDKGSRAFSCILRDTERSATFACLTSSCFTIEPWLLNCQKTPKPQWKNCISALSTSVCQYQWSRVKDRSGWKKVSRDDLKQGAFYWMGNSNDRRRVTAEADSQSLTKLTISDSPMNWGFLCRAWERIERIRRVPHIELREKSLMTEDYARDVLIVREQMS